MNLQIVESIDEAQKQTWTWIVLMGYKEALAKSNGAPDIMDIIYEINILNEKCSYDEMFHFNFDYTEVSDMLLLLKVYFSIQGKEYGDCQNVFLPRYGEMKLLVGGEIIENRQEK